MKDNNLENYYELADKLNNCKNDRELMRVATYIMENSKHLRLSDSDMDKLEQIGIRKHEQIILDGTDMMRNSKIGSKR